MSVEKKLENALLSNNPDKIDLVFEEIYYLYGKLVGFVISKYVFVKEDIEELINDVFISFYNNLNTIEFKSIKYYLVTSAKNKAIDFLRKKKEEVLLDDDYIFSVSDNKSLYYQIVDDLKRCLKENEIEIILLHVIYNFSFKEISNIQNKPLTTISTIYSNAIKKYKRWRKDNGL